MDKIDQFKIKNQDLAESFMPGRDKVFGAILGAAKQHAEQKGKRDQLRAMLEPEMAGGGNVVKALAKAVKAVDVLPAAERQTNLDKLLQASKVPMRLYHGTTATEGGKGTDAIRSFKPSKEGSLGSGVYLSPNAEFASSYAERSGGNVLPVHVQMENPLVLHGSENPEKYLDPMIEALTRLGMDGPKARKMVERAYDTKGYIGKEVESRARAAGYDGLMQYRNGNLEEVVSYNPSSIKSAIGNVGTFDTTINDLSKKTGGDVHMARGGDIKALINAVKALDLPPAAASQRTQIPGTEPTYRKAKEILDREMPGGRTLDYGSGLGIGSRVLGSESFEPFPREGVAPTYTRAEDIPSDAFHRLVNLNMLNVVPRDVRDAAVENIGRVMRPGGMGLVTTRGKDVMKASGELGPEPNSMITSIGTYQKGFTPEELREYLQYILGNKYDIGRLNLGPAGAVVRKKGMKEGGEVHAANGLPLTFAYDKEDPDALQNWMRESQFGKVDIPAPYKVTPEEVTVARAMRTPAPEMSAKDKLRNLLQEGVKQGKKEIKTLGDPNAVTDLVNRGLIANNPVSGAIDLVNMGLEPFGLGSEMPIGGSAHVQKLMQDYGLTKQERPLLETGLALASPFAPSAAKKVGKLAKDTAPAAREVLHDALHSGMESGLIQGPAYVFIGPKAKTFDKKAAKQFEKMEAAGAPLNETWQEARTFRSPDQMLRQEVGDEPSRLKRERQYDLEVEFGDVKKRIAAEEDRLNELRQSGQISPEEFDAQMDQVVGPLLGARADIAMEYGKTGKMSGPVREHTLKYPTLSKVMYHPELFKAYPSLKTVRAGYGVDKNLESIKGYFSPSQNRMYAESNYTPLTRNILLHEIQHAIQGIEGFGRGSNVSRSISEMLPPDMSENDLIDQLRRSIANMKNRQSEIRDIVGDNKNIYSNDLYKPLALEHINLTKTIEDSNKAIEDIIQQGNSHRIYLRSAGEAEARAAQKRWNMTPEERAATHPLESYDVPLDQLIVKR